MSEEMAENVVQEWTRKINDNSDKAKGWGKAFKMYFIDIDIGYWIKLSMDGKVEKVESGPWKKMKAKEAITTLTSTVEVFEGLTDKSIDGASAFASGQVKIEGSYDALMTLAAAFM